MNPYYKIIGCKKNPFVLRSIMDASRVWIDFDHLETPSSKSRTLIQLIGDKGAGKSTLIQRWRHLHPMAPHTYVPPGMGRFKWPKTADLCFWDEADRIPPMLLGAALRSASKRQATIIAGTHRDLQVEAEKAGLLVVTHYLRGPTIQQLLAFADQRIRMESDQTVGTPHLRLTTSKAKEVVDRCQHSWRLAEVLLHEWAFDETVKLS